MKHVRYVYMYLSNLVKAHIHFLTQIINLFPINESVGCIYRQIKDVFNWFSVSFFYKSALQRTVHMAVAEFRQFMLWIGASFCLIVKKKCSKNLICGPNFQNNPRLKEKIRVYVCLPQLYTVCNWISLNNSQVIHFSFHVPTLPESDSSVSVLLTLFLLKCFVWTERVAFNH